MENLRSSRLAWARLRKLGSIILCSFHLYDRLSCFNLFSRSFTESLDLRLVAGQPSAEHEREGRGTPATDPRRRRRSLTTRRRRRNPTTYQRTWTQSFAVLCYFLFRPFNFTFYLPGFFSAQKPIPAVDDESPPELFLFLLPCLIWEHCSPPVGRFALKCYFLAQLIMLGASVSFNIVSVTEPLHKFTESTCLRSMI